MNSVWTPYSWFFFLLLLSSSTGAVGEFDPVRNSASTVALPIKIQQYLGRTYPSWKQTATAIYCIPKFKQSVVRGDFDGDGSRNYAVKFTHDRKGYIVAFLARGTDYRPYILIETSSPDIKRIGLSLGRKGERNESEDGGVSVLRNDGACESEACYHVYRNGRFHCE